MTTTATPTPSKPNLRAAAYVRASIDRSGESLKITRQEAGCRKLAEGIGADVVTVIADDDTSAYLKKRRPGFERLLAMVEGGEVDVILAYHPDRLYRRLADLETIVSTVEGRNVQIHTVAAGGALDLSTASGRMVARMLGAAAQAESERIGERVRYKNAELAAAGKVSGGKAPYAYRKTTADHGYEVVEAEAEVVRYMARRIVEGAGLRTVARELVEQGVPTRSGKAAWSASVVRKIVVNPAQAGLRALDGEVVGEGRWSPVLDRETWESVLVVLTDPARRRRQASTVYPLSGLVCDAEGNRMVGAARARTKGGENVREYRVSAHVAGVRSSIVAEVVEAVVFGAVLDRTDEAALPTVVAVPNAATGVVAALEAELAELGRDRGEGLITRAEWIAAMKPLKARLEAAKAEAGTVAKATAAQRFAALLSTPGAVRAARESGAMSDDEWREVVFALVERIVIAPAGANGGAGWRSAADRVEVKFYRP